MIARLLPDKSSKSVKDELDNKTLVELPIEPKIPPRFMIMLSNSKFPLSIAAQSFWDYLN